MMTDSQLRAVRRARTILADQLRAGVDLSAPDMLHEFLQMHFAGRTAEALLVLALDDRRRLLAAETIAEGSLRCVGFPLRQIAAFGLWAGATALIVAHNHPASDATPGPTDILTTRGARILFAMLEMNLIEHFVLSGDQVLAVSDFSDESPAAAAPAEDDRLPTIRRFLAGAAALLEPDSPAALLVEAATRTASDR